MLKINCSIYHAILVDKEAEYNFFMIVLYVYEIKLSGITCIDYISVQENNHKVGLYKSNAA